MTVTADSTLWTADTHCVTADGRIVCIDAEVAEVTGATDRSDAVVEPAQIVVGVGGGYYRPLLPDEVVGVGYALLPGVVGAARGSVGQDNQPWADDLELLLILALAA